MKLRERKPRPRKIGLYGVHGVGKSTFAAESPRPIFLDFEGGVNDLDVAATEQITDWNTVVKLLDELRNDDHNFLTVVIDTVDWLERLIHADVCAANSVQAIEEIEYGKGYGQAMVYWRFLWSSLDQLRYERQMQVIVLAHAKVAKFHPPDSDSYDRYEPALHDKASRVMQEWCDDFLFAQFETFTRTEKGAFGKERKLAVGGRDRVIHTREAAAMVAKNRLGLPEKMPLSYVAYAEYAYPEQEPTPQSIEGVVVDGSSKKKSKPDAAGGSAVMVNVS